MELLSHTGQGQGDFIRVYTVCISRTGGTENSIKKENVYNKKRKKPKPPTGSLKPLPRAIPPIKIRPEPTKRAPRRRRPEAAVPTAVRVRLVPVRRTGAHAREQE